MDIYGIRVANSYYDMSTSLNDVAVSYTTPDVISIGSDRCLSEWVLINENKNKEINLTAISPEISFIESNFKIKGNGINFSYGDKISIYRQGSMNLYAKYIGAESSDFHAIYIEPSVISYLESIRIDWYNMKNYKAKLENPINLITGLNDAGDISISLNIISNQYIEFNMRDQHHVIVIPEKLMIDEWHGIVLNMGNTWNQFNLYIWKEHEIDSVNKLYNLFYETLKIESADVQVKQYNLNKSNSHITNIRLYNSTLEEEKQVSELLSYIIKDGDKAIISDNCEPLYKSPYIGKQR